jgi:hypothetical protein
VGGGWGREYPAGNGGCILTRRTVFLLSCTEIKIYLKNGKLILDGTGSLIN